MRTKLTVLLVAAVACLTGCASIEVKDAGVRDLIHPEQIVGPSLRPYLVSDQGGQISVREGKYDKSRQKFIFPGLLPGKYSVFNLSTGLYTDGCSGEHPVKIDGFFEDKTVSFSKNLREVMVSLTTGNLKLPTPLGNDLFTVVRIDKYTTTGELDRFSRFFDSIPRTGQGGHRNWMFYLEQGKYRLAIFAPHRNPAWPRDYRNYGKEPWRKEWLLGWRKEYTDMYTATFEVPEWTGGPEETPPVWRVKIAFDVGQTNSEASVVSSPPVTR